MQILETLSGYILQLELYSKTPEAREAIVCEELQVLLTLMAIQKTKIMANMVINSKPNLLQDLKSILKQ